MFSSSVIYIAPLLLLCTTTVSFSRAEPIIAIFPNPLAELARLIPECEKASVSDAQAVIDEGWKCLQSNPEAFAAEEMSTTCEKRQARFNCWSPIENTIDACFGFTNSRGGRVGKLFRETVRVICQESDKLAEIPTPKRCASVLRNLNNSPLPKCQGIDEFEDKNICKFFVHREECVLESLDKQCSNKDYANLIIDQLETVERNVHCDHDHGANNGGASNNSYLGLNYLLLLLSLSYAIRKIFKVIF